MGSGITESSTTGHLSLPLGPSLLMTQCRPKGEATKITSMIIRSTTREALKRRFLISVHRHRISKAAVWFIDIPRTSSTSTNIQLRDRFGWPYGKAKDVHPLCRLIRDHTPASEVKEALGCRLWEEIFTFSLVRNPWKRYLSLYLLCHLRRKKTARDALAPASELKSSFKHVVISGMKWGGTVVSGERHHPQWKNSAKTMLFDRENNLLVNFVGTYENREKDLAYIGKQIGFPDFGQSQKPNDSLLSHLGYSYCEYYDNELRDKVAEASRWEIERFNYSFGE